jgi:hypothetical protein
MRAVLAAASAVVLGLSALLGTTAATATAATAVRGGIISGDTGDPEPEVRPFSLGPAEFGGSVAQEPDGDLVVAYGIRTGHGETVVCVLKRGTSKCSSRTTLSPLSGDTAYADTFAFVSSPEHVEVVLSACCDSNPDGGELLYRSTNGGVTFGAPVRIGTLGSSAAALVGQDIVTSEGLTGSGQVESVPLTASGPPASIATPVAGQTLEVGLADYRGGVLFADDDGGTPDTIHVAYAPAGSNFNATSSYRAVGTFTNQALMGISGKALLTRETTGSQAVELRFFGGSSFGAPHVVPDTKGSGAEAFGLVTDPGGQVNVFNDSTNFPAPHGLYQESTTTGTKWSWPFDLGRAAASQESFAAGLDAAGSGLVLQTTPSQATAYPVLSPQTVSFSIAKRDIALGHSTTASGRALTAARGRLIELQVERLPSGRWYNVAATRENASGGFRFTLKGSVAGAHVYRAVADDLAGWVQFGYSVSRTLRVTH